MQASHVTTASSAAPTARPTEVETPGDLMALVGTQLGTSPWIEVSQPDIDDFARITRDEQWIHVDRERALSGPFEKTIAHGFFVLSLCSYFCDTTLTIRSSGMGLNYGLDRVRFTAPVPVGSRVRGRVILESATPIDNGVQMTLGIIVEIHGHEKPACVAKMVARAYD